MNVKEYISSGAIESYVLGLATEAEQKELEDYCLRYPEIAAAKLAFEQALENQLVQDAVAPPAQLKETVLANIRGAGTDAGTVRLAENKVPVRSITAWKWLAAACFLLMAGAGWWAFQTNNKYNALQARTQKMQEQLNAQSNQLAAMTADRKLLQNQGMKMAAMHGPNNPAIYSTIYWDTLSKDVYLMINNLPKPASDKQYQLWALLNGQPIDLGVIEARQERLLYRMKNVQAAQAFAITLEPKGGSAQPSGAPVVLSNL